MNDPVKIQTLYFDNNGLIAAKNLSEHSDVLTWHHMHHTSAKAKTWLKKQSHISDQAKAILVATETRPRLIADDDAIIMCLRGINLNNNQAPEDMISIRLWINQDTIISSSGRQSRSLANIQKMMENGEGPRSISNWLNMLIEQLALLTDDFVNSLEDMLDVEEDNIAESSFETFNPKMSKIRRQVAAVKRFLSPQKEALDKLYRSKTQFLTENFYDLLYVQIDRFTHLLENLDLLRERVLVLQEQFMAYISHQQNARLYLLAIVSAIFLPLTFLSGLLGMNVGGLPGLESSSAFWVVAGFCGLVTVGLLVWFKKSKWF